MPMLDSQPRNTLLGDLNLDESARDRILREIADGAKDTDAYDETLERALQVSEKDLRTQVSI
jgi:hypothetical protein